MKIMFIATGIQPIPIINSYWAILEELGDEYDQVFLLYHKKHEGMVKKTKTIINNINDQFGITPNIEMIEVPEDDINEIKTIISDRLESIDSEKIEQISFNITAGSKILFLAIIKFAKQFQNITKIRTYYLSLKEKKYFNVPYSYIPPYSQKLVEFDI